MATLKHAKDQGMGYASETNFAGGDAGAEKAMTEFNLIGDFTAFDVITNFRLPSSENEEVVVEELGNTSLEQVSAVDVSKVLYEPGFVETHLQCGPNSADWYNEAIDQADAIGSPPNEASRAIRFDNGSKELEAYGNYLIEYNLSCTNNEFLMQRVDWWSYFTIRSAADLAMSTKGFTDEGTYRFLTWRDVTTFTIEGVNPRPLDFSFTVTKTPKEDDTEIGTRLREELVLNKKAYRLELTFLDSVTFEALAAKKYAYAEDVDFVLVVNNPTDGDIINNTFSNWRVESINQHESTPPADFIKYTAVLVSSTTGFAVT